MDELSSAAPKRVTLAPRLGYEDSPREDAALVLEDAAQSRVTLAPRGEPQRAFRAPKNREASISLDRCRVNAKDMLLAKNKSSAIDQGIGATFDFLKKI